jgi:hypothetical protein
MLGMHIKVAVEWQRAASGHWAATQPTTAAAKPTGPGIRQASHDQ